MKKKQDRVLVFGTFDGIHPGHIFFLKKAAELGDLYVSVATDVVTKILKGRFPKHTEKEREVLVEKLGIAHLVIIGEKEIESWKTLKTLTPDIVAVGYDQKHLKIALTPLSLKLGFKIKTIKGFEPKKYHSKILNS